MTDSCRRLERFMRPQEQIWQRPASPSAQEAVRALMRSIHRYLRYPEALWPGGTCFSERFMIVIP
jgi:hypothetical protein